MQQPPAPTAHGRTRGWIGSREIGYWALLLLAFLLPSDMERRQLVWTTFLTITNLTVALLIVAALAMMTVAGLAIDAFRGAPGAAAYFSRRRVPLVLFVAFLLSCAVSTILAPSTAQSLTWFLDVLSGALLWLALPLWLAGDNGSKINRLGTAIVAGAVVASVVGLIEVQPGSTLDQHLLLFRSGPDIMGPIRRLSATFSSANVAAMYFELALPFAIAGLIVALGRVSRRWITITAWLAAIDLILAAIVLTYSRGAALGLLAAGLAMAVAGRRSLRRLRSGQWRAATIVGLNLFLLCGLFAVSVLPTIRARLSTENDRAWYQASYVSSVPATMAAGTPRTVEVTVENRTPLTWNASVPRTYGVSYHWLHTSLKVVRFANNITWLSADLPPGSRRTVRAQVEPPRTPGRYLLIWDVVWKDAVWFGPRSGTYQYSVVRVTQGKAPSGQPHALGKSPPPDISELPTAPALDRGQIWAAAIALIKKRPFFGWGPQGFRMNYTAVAPPEATARARPPPPHAHNLALEIVADWGLIGGAIFLAFLAALWGPFLRRALRGRVECGWELAVVGAAAAVLGHGLVDYFLTKQAMIVLLWLLCGLTAAISERAATA